MGWTRRIWQLVGGLALVAAVIASLAVRREQRHEQVTRQQSAQRARAQAGRAALRPLDPAVRAGALPGELTRRVLGLYNGDEPEVDAESNLVHLRAELILNHLGLLVDVRDVNQPLPGEQEMSRYLGVVTWFGTQTMKDPRGYLKWLAAQARAGRKVVILDGLGATQDRKGQRTTDAEQAAALEAIGIRFLGHFTNDPSHVAVESKDSAMVEFERKLPVRLEHYEQFQLIDPAGKSYLKLRRTDREDSASDVVAVTPKGGFVAPSYVMQELRFGANFVMVWRINPFRFFAEALGVTATPRPDFTTLGGARIFYSHIDGDGFPSITELDYKSMCGDFTRTQILEAYDLPVTVSLVVAEIKPPPRGLGNAERVAAARKIAALPNVEMGCHGLAHPMDWRARQHAICSYELPGYRMHPEDEILFASRWIRDVINPPGKPTRVMLWTGWCNPSEDMVALADDEGLYNLNGGDPVMNGEYPSYMHLAPPVHQVGKRRQYFTSGPNEYILTEEWHPPYHRWRNMIDMFARTEAPYRIVPMNIYYHFYVVEKPAALAAMRDIMDWVLRQQPAPLFVSEYIDVVRDFEDLRVARVEAGSDEAWRVRNSGYCRTVRFDRFDRHVDLERSRGVIGYRLLPAQQALFVHLDDSHDHTIVLSPKLPAQPHIRRATSYVDQLQLGQDRVTFVTRGIGRKYITVANLRPDARYRVEAVNEDGKRDVEVLWTYGNGSLEWDADLNGREIKVTITREGSGG